MQLDSKRNETNAVVNERRRTLMADSTDHQNSGLGCFNVLWIYQKIDKHLSGYDICCINQRPPFEMVYISLILLKFCNTLFSLSCQNGCFSAGNKLTYF